MNNAMTGLILLVLGALLWRSRKQNTGVVTYGDLETGSYVPDGYIALSDGTLIPEARPEGLPPYGDPGTGPGR